jgi:6-phospho-3-hexuloisomerase
MGMIARMDIQRDDIDAATGELHSTLQSMDNGAVATLTHHVLSLGRIACYGLGRELLSLRAFCMRLVHLGIDAHVAGDVTARPVGKGDLVIVSAGPGKLAMAETIVDLARDAGATIVALTAQPDGPVPRKADHVIVIPAQTMADDAGSTSILPTGTAYEIAMLIYLDLVAIALRKATGLSMEDLRERHFNLE